MTEDQTVKQHEWRCCTCKRWRSASEFDLPPIERDKRCRECLGVSRVEPQQPEAVKG